MPIQKSSPRVGPKIREIFELTDGGQSRRFTLVQPVGHCNSKSDVQRHLLDFGKLPTQKWIAAFYAAYPLWASRIGPVDGGGNFDQADFAARSSWSWLVDVTESPSFRLPSAPTQKDYLGKDYRQYARRRA